jgi:hypothetical protein
MDTVMSETQYEDVINDLNGDTISIEVINDEIRIETGSKTTGRASWLEISNARVLRDALDRAITSAESHLEGV